MRTVATIPAVADVKISKHGLLEDWESVPTRFDVDRFVSPWDDRPFGRTEFSALADANWLFFRFQVEASLLISVPFTQKRDVALGDRVEIFLSGDSTLADYYCIEIGPYGNVLDYRAAYYRAFDNTWNLPDLTVTGNSTTQGYVVEGRIPLHFLRGLAPHNSSTGLITFYMGLYRAAYYRPHTEADPVQWLTWIDPNTNEPDFHVPTSFQVVRIETS